MFRQWLNSDMWKLFHYDEYRYCYPDETMSDVYDRDAWKYFEMLMGEGEKFIGLRFCSDGFDMFNYTGKSACPSIVQILNLPPSLRKIINFGMHMCSPIHHCAGVGVPVCGRWV